MGYAAPLGPEALPIPPDVVPGPGWTAEMCEMADHIGAYETLLLSERFGGQQLYIPADPARSAFVATIGAAKAARFSEVYGGEVLTIAKADYAIRRARRGSVLAAVRADRLSVSEAARLLGLRRDYASKLVNRTDEGRGISPLASSPGRGGRAHDPRQMDMFPADPPA